MEEPEWGKSNEEALTDLLVSIAAGESALANLMNAEAEKVRTVRVLLEAGKITLDEVIEVQRSVSRVMQAAVKMQMLLEFETENVLCAQRELNNYHRAAGEGSPDEE